MNDEERVHEVIHEGVTAGFNAGVEAAMKELRKLAIWGHADGSHRYTKAMDALRALKK